MIPALKPGKRVFVSEFGDSPTDAIEHFIRLRTSPHLIRPRLSLTSSSSKSEAPQWHGSIC